MDNKLNNYSRGNDQKKVEELPNELKEQLEKFNKPDNEPDNEPDISLIKRPKGRPVGTSGGVKRNKMSAPWAKHGAYSFIAKGKLPKEKMHLLKFVNQERWKWMEQLGGKENLTYMEISLIDEATRLLFYFFIINYYLLRNVGEDIVYKDKDTGELKMHSALSRNYLSYTKTYVNIIKELNKINRLSVKKAGGKDMASQIQTIMNKK